MTLFCHTRFAASCFVLRETPPTPARLTPLVAPPRVLLTTEQANNVCGVFTPQPRTQPHNPCVEFARVSCVITPLSLCGGQGVCKVSRVCVCVCGCVWSNNDVGEGRAVVFVWHACVMCQERLRCWNPCLSVCAQEPVSSVLLCGCFLTHAPQQQVRPPVAARNPRTHYVVFGNVAHHASLPDCAPHPPSPRIGRHVGVRVTGSRAAQWCGACSAQDGEAARGCEGWEG